MDGFNDVTGFDTLAIHAGQEPDPASGAVVPPIYQASTYKQDGIGGLRGGYEYSRTANPTRAALEECLAALEGGVRGLAFASGMAAEDTLLRTICKPGDHVVIPDDAYGGTYRLISKVLKPWGLEYDPVPVAGVDAVRAALRPDTKVVWVETPTNPLLGIADIAALAQVAHDAGALLVVDNTFASPYLQRPLALGADVVVFLSSLFLGGLSVVLGGVLVVSVLGLGGRNPGDGLVGRRRRLRGTRGLGGRGALLGRGKLDLVQGLALVALDDEQQYERHDEQRHRRRQPDLVELPVRQQQAEQEDPQRREPVDAGQPVEVAHHRGVGAADIAWRRHRRGGYRPQCEDREADVQDHEQAITTGHGNDPSGRHRSRPVDPPVTPREGRPAGGGPPRDQRFPPRRTRR